MSYSIEQGFDLASTILQVYVNYGMPVPPMFCVGDFESALPP